MGTAGIFFCRGLLAFSALFVAKFPFLRISNGNPVYATDRQTHIQTYGGHCATHPLPTTRRVSITATVHRSCLISITIEETWYIADETDSRGGSRGKFKRFNLVNLELML